MKESLCPGCGLKLSAQAGLPDPKFQSSAECWALYAELTGTFTLTLADPAFPHQHAVDAYEAQHIGPGSKPIAAVFSLLGLCLALEKGATGRQVQLAHMALAKTKRDWPQLLPKLKAYELTVRDPVQALGTEAKLKRLTDWMRCTWDAWEHEHGKIRQITEEIQLRSL